MMYYLTLLFFISCTNAVHEIAQENEPFIPTHEWQRIKPGQTVPSGLHYQFNLEGGYTQAKLMDSHHDSNAIQVIEEKPSETVIDKPFSDDLVDVQREQYMKDLSKRIHSGAIPLGVKKNFEELEKEKEDDFLQSLRDKKVDVKSEYDVITDTLNGLSDPSSPIMMNNDKLIEQLGELDDLAHKLQNGVTIVRHPKFPFLLSLFNHTEPKVVAQTLLALGSAIQSNTEAQSVLNNKEFLPMIMELLKRYTAILSAHFNQEVELPCRRLLYSLSAYLRSNPSAQTKFIDNDGFKTLAILLQTAENQSPRIVSKILTLTRDLLHESGLTVKTVPSLASWCSIVGSSKEFMKHEYGSVILSLLEC